MAFSAPLFLVRRLYRPRGRRFNPFSLCRLAIVSALLGCAGTAFNVALAQGTCTVDGAPAYCVAPQVSPYWYQVSDGYTSARAATEAEAISAYEAAFRQSYINANSPVCTLSMVDNLPPWQPTRPGTGWVQQGDYGSALAGIGQYWDLYWKFGVEYQAQRIPLVRTATYTRFDDTQPCQRTDGPKGVYVYRQRDVSCPGWPFWASICEVLACDIDLLIHPDGRTLFVSISKN